MNFESYERFYYDTEEGTTLRPMGDGKSEIGNATVGIAQIRLSLGRAAKTQAGGIDPRLRQRNRQQSVAALGLDPPPLGRLIRESQASEIELHDRRPPKGRGASQ